MTQDTKYNGWTNYETWNLNLWFDDFYSDDAQRILDSCEGDKDAAIKELADYIESNTEEMLSEEMPKTGFLADICNSALREVNYYEIAKNYIAEVDKESDAA
jgi:hypothetical protein